MRHKAALLALISAVALVACDALDPYVTTPHVVQPKEPPGLRLAICYNPAKTTAAAVTAQAQPQCPTNTVATRVYTDWYLQYCPLLLPGRATFVCAAAKK